MFEHIKTFVDIFLHLDKYLGPVIQEYGAWVYCLLFAIIFAETGLVVTPILPGDSLLFVTGTFSATGNLDVWIVFITLSIAAILGDTVNYWIGRKVGPRVFTEESRYFRKEYLERTHAFYEKHGGKTIIIARFMPIIRTFAPFVAGIAAMTYPKFLIYNIVGGIAWIGIFVFGGYFFGNIPFVKKNLTLVVMIIIFLSILPGIIEYWRARRASADTLQCPDIPGKETSEPAGE